MAGAHVNTLCPVVSEADIFPQWRGTPIGDFLRYHNLGAPPRDYARADLLIGMCMDNRKSLRIPENFAFILRTGAANLRRVEFKVSFAIAIGGVRAIAIMGHDDCGMIHLSAKRELFIERLVEIGWRPGDAAAHFDANVRSFEIQDPADFVVSEVQRLRVQFRSIPIAPLFYRVGDGLIYQIAE
jgi:carbonic anhydrase